MPASSNGLAILESIEELKAMKTILIGAAALALVAPAVAQVAPVQQQRPLRGQQAQTRADVQAKVAERFARLDSNRDGFITRAEADAARQQLRTRFAARSGERRERAFERLDTNRDGAISRAEWDSRAAQRQQRLARRDRDGDGRPDVRGGRRGLGMMGLGGRMFEMADANRDGRVSLAEAQTAALRHFDMMDSNRDGRLTPEERMQMRQHRGTMDHRG
jgi:Ca2+-binding EF-hand superfamily protein